MIKAFALLFVLGCAYAEMPGIWLQEVDFTPRIIKGEDASEGEFPYMISLRRSASNSHACGGSILTSRWALTAAHCCAIGTPSQLHVVVGSIYQGKVGFTHEIEKYIIHDKYDAGNKWKNDICLIKLKTAIKLDRNAAQITLPTQNWPVNSGDRLTISGWGYITPNPPQIVPSRLQKAEGLIALSNDECGGQTGTSMFPGYLCARGGQPGRGVCNGDSGSPLVKKRVQVGIASWVFLPCGSGKPDFYARVPNYIDWIKAKLGSDARDLKFVQ